MSSFKIDPPKDWVAPADPSKYAEEAQKYILAYRDYVKETITDAIAASSVDDILKHNEFVILYSGPSKDVYKKITCLVTNNDIRSSDMAFEYGASRINDTTAGITLNGIKLDPHFRPILEKIYSDPDELSDAVNDAYATVWGGISELFADLDFKTAATAVCGAGQDRVFVKDELPVLVRNPHVQTINEIDMDAVRRMYDEVSPDEAFRLVCLSELQMTVKKAHASGVPPTEGWTDFFERHFFYAVERDDTEVGIPLLSDDQRKRKEAIISDFKLQGLFAVPPLDWAKPHKPPAKLTPPAKHAPKLH